MANNLNTSGQLDATDGLTGTIPDSNLPTISASKGGTGRTSLTANNVLLGNGTSAVQFVAPSTSGNVLTSNGTTWVSSTPTSSAPTTAQVLSATAGATAGAIGTYMLAVKRTNSSVSFNSTQSGSDLFASDAQGNSNQGSTAGTWRCMGYSQSWSGGCSTTVATTVWLRIS